MQRSILALSISLALIAGPAMAGQKLYVQNQGNSTLTVIDSWTGVVLGDFPTKTNVRDLDAAHHAEFVVIAGGSDLGLAHSANNYRRMDLQFRNAGLNSTAVGLSPDDRYIYLAQTDPDWVYRVDLGWGGWFQDDCLGKGPDDHHDCPISDSAILELDPQVADPLHMAVCDDGAVYVVGASGQVARHEASSNGFGRLGVAPAPDDPRGIACTPDNGVFIMSGDRILTELSAGPNPVVTAHTNIPVADPGRIDVDPRHFRGGFQVLLTDRDSGEIVRFQNGAVIERIALWPDKFGNRRLPWAVTASAHGWLGTANQGVEGATILYQSWAQLPRGNGPQPIDADFGPVLGAAVEANPHSLEFVYGVGGSSGGSRQTMELRSTGTSDLNIASLQIDGDRAFTIAGHNCTNGPLAPGQTCDVTIEFANPGGNGAPGYAHFRADLRVTHNGTQIFMNDFPLQAIHFKEYLAELEKSGLSAQEEDFYLR